MWAPVTDVPLGNPVSVTWKVAVALVMTPLLSLFASSVIVATPLPVNSTFTTGGTSLPGESCAVNVAVCLEGSVVELHAFAVTRRAMAAHTRRDCFIVGPLAHYRRPRLPHSFHQLRDRP